MTALYKSEEGRQLVHARYAHVLDNWPVASKRLRLATREGETFVLAWGPGTAPAVLLLQGSGGSAAMWLREAAAWGQSLRLYAVDIIGEPGFSAPSRPPLESEAYALWLDDVMDGLGLPSASFVGVSLGGWLALDYARRRPARVVRTVVMSPSGIGRQRASFLFKVGALMLLGRWGRRKAMRLALGPQTTQPDSVDREIGTLAMLIARHFNRRRARIPIVSDEELRTMAMPIMAIVGAHDALIDSGETKSRLERLSPRATVRFLPDAGHMLRGQADAVLEFLNSEPAATDPCPA